MKRSTEIFDIYLKYIAPGDIHVLVLTVRYDIDNLTATAISKSYLAARSQQTVMAALSPNTHTEPRIWSSTLPLPSRLLQRCWPCLTELSIRTPLIQNTYLAAMHVIDEADAPAAVCEQRRAPSGRFPFHCSLGMSR